MKRSFIVRTSFFDDDDDDCQWARVIPGLTPAWLYSLIGLGDMLLIWRGDVVVYCAVD